MFDFAVLAIKVLFFIWAAQLILLGWILLRRTVKRVLRPFSEGTSAKIQALRSAGVVDVSSLVELLSRRRIKHLLALLLSVMSSAALAQTTGAPNPSPVPAQPSVNDDVPPGGCMPIGLTVSGQVVFPIQCKEFIERHRGAAVEQKPAAVEEKSAAKRSEEVAPENGKLENKPETAPLSKR